MTVTRRPDRRPADVAVSTLGLQRKLAEAERKLHGAVELLAVMVERAGGTLTITSAETDALAGKVVSFQGGNGSVTLTLKEKATDAAKHN